MRANRSMPMSTVIPVLAYEDLGRAIDWLCAAFGFTERWRPEATAPSSESVTPPLR
jgi:uncharacterized glyoxalase superfamily protein PhnB